MEDTRHCMINMFGLAAELNKFNFVKFEDESHTYTIGKQKLKSVTTLIGEFEDEFDSEFWSVKKALDMFYSNFDYNKFKRTFTINEVIYTIPEVLSWKPNLLDEKLRIQKQWSDKAYASTVLGSAIHNYIEFFYANKIYNPGKEVVKLHKERYKIGIKLFNLFYKKTKDYLIPVKSEFVVADKEFMIGGMIDQLFYNTKTNMLEIWDWKTNEKIDKSNQWNKMKSIFRKFDECESIKYSIQLNTYKYILEKNTNLKIGNCRFVHFDTLKKKVKVHNCLDFQKEVGMMFAY